MTYVFGIGLDHTLWYRTLAPGDPGWQSLGG